MKNIAVAGFGFMGLTHCINIMKNENLKLVGIIDKDPATISKTLTPGQGNIATGTIDSEEIRSVKKFSSLDACFDIEKVDAVSICVPTIHHYQLAKQALESGKHVLLEKPFCLDILKAEELISLAGIKDRVLMIGHVVRFMPAYRKLKEFIDSKEYGELKFLSFSRFTGRPGWGDWIQKEVADSSGGALFDLIVHDIDFANYILGMPDEIQSRCLPGPLSNHDYVNAYWKYNKKDILLKIEGGNNFHVTLPFQAGFLANFERASIAYSSLSGNNIRIADDHNLSEMEVGDPSMGYYSEIEYFGHCIENNLQPLQCMPDSSLQAIKLCYKHI